jgi:hypothetical protein
LASENFSRFLYFAIRRYIKFTLISDKYQYRIPNTQYHVFNELLIVHYEGIHHGIQYANYIPPFTRSL